MTQLAWGFFELLRFFQVFSGKKATGLAVDILNCMNSSRDYFSSAILSIPTLPSSSLQKQEGISQAQRHASLSRMDTRSGLS